MENGDIGISNFSAILPEKSKIKADVSIINTTKGPIIEFATNFSTNDAIKFFRKLGFYGFEQNEFSLFLDGIIDLSTQKIKFKKIIKNNNEKINDQEILLIEKNLNHIPGGVAYSKNSSKFGFFNNPLRLSNSEFAKWIKKKKLL